MNTEFNNNSKPFFDTTSFFQNSTFKLEECQESQTQPLKEETVVNTDLLDTSFTVPSFNLNNSMYYTEEVEDKVVEEEIIINTKETVLEVPAGIRFISEWARLKSNPYKIPNHPCIIDKQLTGCGFTQYIIDEKYNQEHVVLCSPRVVLLKSKSGSTEGTYYFNNDTESGFNYDFDKTSSNVLLDSKDKILNLKKELGNYIDSRLNDNKPVKILVTYDSFRLVREVLEYRQFLSQVRVVVDEFQSIFTDAAFKSGTSLQFVDHLQGIDKLCYVSATPMMTEYLDEVDEFKNLPIYKMDWCILEPSRVVKPDITVKSLLKGSVTTSIKAEIDKYKEGRFNRLPVVENGVTKYRESKELVIFINSIRDICSIINNNDLKPEEVCIICANNKENRAYITKRLSRKYKIEIPPKIGEVNKMFTFCTKTTYYGADFYSDNARTVILSNAVLDTLAVDITLDLPQIMGRQRLNSNPWKTSADIYVGLLFKDVNEDEFNKMVDNKMFSSNKMIEIINDENIWEGAREELKIASKNPIKYYVEQDKDNKAVINKFLKLAEKRAFDIGKLNYSDRFVLYSSIRESFNLDASSENIDSFFKVFNSETTIVNKMKALCEWDFTDEELASVLLSVPLKMRTYVEILGRERCKSCCYNTTKMNNYVEKVIKTETKNVENINKQDLLDKEIISCFKVGEWYSLTEIKSVFRGIFDKLGIESSSKATLIKEYFDVSLSYLRKVKGYKINKIKKHVK